MWSNTLDDFAEEAAHLRLRMGSAGIFLDCVAQGHLTSRRRLVDWEPLAVDDRFGQSGDIPDLYRAYGIDTDAILDATARACLTALRQAR
jgi:hypothetical protein